MSDAREGGTKSAPGEAAESADAATSADSAIVVASNRLPFTLDRDADGKLVTHPSFGGLVAALEPVLRRRGGTWVGWPGLEIGADEKIPGPDRPYHVRPVLLSAQEVERHYDGFSNATIWPLFHIYLVRRFDMNPWKFAGWGMYSAPQLASQVRVFVWIGGTRRELKPASLELNRAIQDFRRLRRGLRKLIRPGALARSIREFHPEVERLQIVVFQRVLNRKTGMIEEERDEYHY